MAQSSNRIKVLEDMLIEEKKRLWAEVRRDLFQKVGEKLHEQYEIPQDIGDRGLIDSLEDTGLAVADIRRQELTRIDEALNRLQQGEYGRCEDCGEEINVERLKAAPYAPCCIDCQKKREGPASGPGRTL